MQGTDPRKTSLQIKNYYCTEVLLIIESIIVECNPYNIYNVSWERVNVISGY